MKIHALALCLALPLGAFAQYRQGSTALGGSASLNSSSNGGPNVTYFSIGPTVAYSYSDAGALGVSASYDWREDMWRNGSVNLFWRYNLSLADRFGAYGSAGPGLYLYSSSYSDYFSWSLSAAAWGGLYYFPVDWLSVELSLANLSYSYGKTSVPGPDGTHKSLTAGVSGNGLGLTLLYHF
jgi:hypothetical protein